MRIQKSVQVYNPKDAPGKKSNAENIAKIIFESYLQELCRPKHVVLSMSIHTHHICN